MPLPDLGRLADLFISQPPPVRIEGRRVLLRPPARADWPAWRQLRAASRTFLQPWEPSWTDDALSHAAFRRRLARYALDWRGDEGYSFLLVRRDDQAILGGAGLANVRRGVAECGSIGYWIGQPYAHQGYMTEAVALLLDFAFDRLSLHRVEAACLPHNAPSRGLLAKAGFREEGYARHYLCIDGQWQDHALFGLLRQEWLARRRLVDQVV